MQSLFMRFILISCSILVSSCGIGEKNSDDPIKTENPQVCPSIIYPIHHTINIQTTERLPEKVAVTVDGVLKYDNCLERPEIVPPAPAVFVRKQNNELEIVVRHLDAYPALPSEVSFEVFDRKNCVAPATLFFAANKVPLVFKTEYLYGVKCGGNTFASVNLKK